MKSKRIIVNKLIEEGRGSSQDRLAAMPFCTKETYASVPSLRSSNRVYEHKRRQKALERLYKRDDFTDSTVIRDSTST
jgi:hypothetical protein